MDNRDRMIEEMSNWTPEEVATTFAKWISEDEAGEVCDAYGIERNENDEEEYEDDLLCPLGGDETDDCDGCAYSLDYHFVDGECVRREEF